jgi:hypothetical protein
MKNSNDTIGNRSRDLPICSAVPQPLRNQQTYPSERTCTLQNLQLHVAFVYHMSTDRGESHQTVSCFHLYVKRNHSIYCCKHTTYYKQMHSGFMNVILLPNGHYNKYIYETKLHLMVFNKFYSPN